MISQQVYYCVTSSSDMEPVDFQLVVLPLTALISLLVVVVLYYAREEEEKGKELEELREQLRSGTITKKTFERKKSRLTQMKTFTEELEKLKDMLQKESIDEHTYQRFKKILKRAYKIETKQQAVPMESDSCFK